MYLILLLVTLVNLTFSQSNETTTTSEPKSCFYLINQANPSLLDEICFPTSSVTFDEITSEPLAENDSLTFSSNVAMAEDLDIIWLIFCGSLVFLMQAGFGMLEAGSVKSANTQNILFKNLMDACVGAIIWYFFGFNVAYGGGTGANIIIGNGNVALYEFRKYWDWFFQWAFAATAATIVSGAVAERCTLIAYFIYTSLLTAWVYPMIVHWVWGDGWLSAFSDNRVIIGGCIDFAGSGVVHMVGGFSGLMGSIFLGPRVGRFNYQKEQIKNNQDFLRVFNKENKLGSSVPLQVIGAVILWFGWYGFNPGSTLFATNSMAIASKVAVTTTLAAISGGIFTAMAGYYLEGFYMVPRVVNGILAGLVSITAPCSVVSPGASIAIGFIGGAIYYGTSRLLERLQIDDPLDAFPVHGMCGVWGVLSVAFFSTPTNIAFAGYNEELQKASKGLIFSNQLLEVVIIIVWTCAFTAITFLILKLLNALRVPMEDEIKGMDEVKHGGNSSRFSIVAAPTAEFEEISPMSPTSPTDDEAKDDIKEEDGPKTNETYGNGVTSKEEEELNGTKKEEDKENDGKTETIETKKEDGKTGTIATKKQLSFKE